MKLMLFLDIAEQGEDIETHRKSNFKRKNYSIYDFKNQIEYHPNN